MSPSGVVEVLDPSSQRWECIVPASNLMGLVVLIISAQTVNFLQTLKGQSLRFFCVPPAIC